MRAYRPSFYMGKFLPREIWGRTFNLSKEGYSGLDVSVDHLYNETVEYKRMISQQPEQPYFVEVEGNYKNNNYQAYEYDTKNIKIPFSSHPVKKLKEKKPTIKDNSPRGEIQEAINKIIGIPEGISKFELAMINQFPAEGTIGHMINQINEREEIEQTVNNAEVIPGHNTEMEITQAIDKVRDMLRHPMG